MSNQLGLVKLRKNQQYSGFGFVDNVCGVKTNLNVYRRSILFKVFFIIICLEETGNVRSQMQTPRNVFFTQHGSSCNFEYIKLSIKWIKNNTVNPQLEVEFVLF